MSPGQFLSAATSLAAVIVGLGRIRMSRTPWRIDDSGAQARAVGAPSPVLAWLRHIRSARLEFRPIGWPRARAKALISAELGAIVLWAMFFARSYLNLDTQLVPAGREFGMGIQSHYIWTLLWRCGACVFWNGFTNGGAPSFVELHGAPLHPLIILATLIWGAVNGAKIVVVASLALAGLAQWWLARTLGLGRLARLWSAGLAVVAGNVAGRMEVGLVPLALSMAMAALVLAACVDLGLKGRRRTAIALGFLLAGFLLSGQGYLQVGMALSVLPALAILLLDRRLRPVPVWREFALAGSLALLLAGVLWVPLLHFWPNLDKDTDLAFSSAQAIDYTPLNLVISDANFYYKSGLGMQPFPYLYTNYIGWVPVLLAAVALRLIPRTQIRLLTFFLVAIALAFLAGSAVTLRWLAVVLPQYASMVRNPPPIAGLAVPLVLSLSAWGLDLLLKLNWPKLNVSLGTQASTPLTVGLSTAWLVLAVPLAGSLKSAYDFNQIWLVVGKVSPGWSLVVNSLRQFVPPGQVEWLQPPWGEEFWLPTAMEAGVKLASYPRPWRWRGTDTPPAFAEGVRAPEAASNSAWRGTVDSINLLLHPENEYAAVVTSTGVFPCGATALGGNIDVTCAADQAGQLVVQEHSWMGWSVRQDGQPAALVSSEWLTTPAPAGRHVFTFRYRPWDVTLGLTLTVAGLLLAVWLLWHRPARPLDGALSA